MSIPQRLRLADQDLPPSQIHETAVVDTLAEIGRGSVVDAYAVIGPQVKIGPGSVIGPKAVLEARSELGQMTVLEPYAIIRPLVRMGMQNRIGSFSVIGGQPQSRAYPKGHGVTLGHGNVVGTHVTIDSGTLPEGTLIGDDVQVMHYSHIAHDCRIGSHVTMCNSVQLAGHVSVGEHSHLYGETVAQQWVRIGEKVMTCARSGILHDIPPYSIAAGADGARLLAPNDYLLKKLGSSQEEIAAVRQAFHALFLRRESADDVEKGSPESLQPLFDFLRGESKHGIMSMKKSRRTKVR